MSLVQSKYNIMNPIHTYILAGCDEMSKINVGSRVTQYPIPVTLVGILVEGRVNYILSHR